MAELVDKLPVLEEEVVQAASLPCQLVPPAIAWLLLWLLSLWHLAAITVTSHRRRLACLLRPVISLTLETCFVCMVISLYSDAQHEMTVPQCHR